MLFKGLLSLVAVASAAAAAPVDERQTCQEATEAELTAAREAFVKEMVDPDVIQNFQPKSTLDVSYPEGAVDLGTEFNLLRKFRIEPRIDPVRHRFARANRASNQRPFPLPTFHSAPCRARTLKRQSTL